MEYDEYGAWDGHATDAWPVAVDQFLERSQRQHNDRLADELDRIDEQLEERNAIHTEIVDELEWKIERYTDRLEHLYKTGTGKQDGTRERVKDRITSFQQQLREEHRDHWRDRQELERERRTILRELAELEEDLSEFLE